MASRGPFLLVAVDTRDHRDRQVIDEAAALARDLGVVVRLVTATTHEASRSSKMLGLDDHADEVDAEKHALMAKLEGLIGPFEQANVPVRCVVAVGDPAQVVLERARLARLVVIGTHGRKGLNRLLFGSVAEEVVRHSPSPVVVVRTHGLET